MSYLKSLQTAAEKELAHPDRVFALKTLADPTKSSLHPAARALLNSHHVTDPALVKAANVKRAAAYNEMVATNEVVKLGGKLKP